MRHTWGHKLQSFRLEWPFLLFCDKTGIWIGHGFKGYPKGRNVERALEPSCPCVLCISHSLGLYLLHHLAKARARRASNDCRATRYLFS